MLGRFLGCNNGGGGGGYRRPPPYTPNSWVDLLVGCWMVWLCLCLCLFTRLALAGSSYTHEVRRIKFPGKNLQTEGDVKLHLDPVSQSRQRGGTGIPLSSSHGICTSLEIDDRRILVRLSQWLEASRFTFHDSLINHGHRALMCTLTTSDKKGDFIPEYLLCMY